jgi:hypothetical protein
MLHEDLKYIFLHTVCCVWYKKLPYLPKCKMTFNLRWPPQFLMASVGFFKVYFILELMGRNSNIKYCCRTHETANWQQMLLLHVQSEKQETKFIPTILISKTQC